MTTEDSGALIVGGSPVRTALSLVGHGRYELGTGDMDTPEDDPTDCAGFAICKCHQLRRHRPGYNRGEWSTVSDDLNSNSVIEDSQHACELFVPVAGDPLPGDLIAYPTIRLKDAHGAVHVFVGHVAIIVDVARWNGTFASLEIVQCIGPNGRTPGIMESTGAHFDEHNATWPKPEHRAWIVRRKA